MSYVDDNLISGEQVLYRTKMHWITLVGACIAGALFAIPGLVMTLGGLFDKNSGDAGLIGFLLLLVAAAIVGIAFLKRASLEMAVTNKRVIAKAGVVSRRTSEMMLGKVETIAVSQGIGGRIFNYGTISLRGSGGTPEVFDTIAAPLEFRKHVQQQLDSIQNRSMSAAAQ